MGEEEESLFRKRTLINKNEKQKIAEVERQLLEV